MKTSEMIDRLDEWSENLRRLRPESQSNVSQLTRADFLAGVSRQLRQLEDLGHATECVWWDTDRRDRCDCGALDADSLD